MHIRHCVWPRLPFCLLLPLLSPFSISASGGSLTPEPLVSLSIFFVSVDVHLCVIFSLSPAAAAVAPPSAYTSRAKPKTASQHSIP